MWKKIVKLIDVKSLLTLSMAGVIYILIFKGIEVPEYLTNQFGILVGFYVGSQVRKSGDA